MSFPESLTGGAADSLGQEALDAIERVLSATPAANVGGFALECASHFAPDRRADLQGAAA